MTVERASAGTMSGDDTLPLVIRLFTYARDEDAAAAADRLRAALAEGLPDVGAVLYEDVMPSSETVDSLELVWRDANPGEDPGERRRHRLTVVAPGLGYAELADLSTVLADVVSPGWASGDAAERAAAEKAIPCRVAVGRADEQPGQGIRSSDAPRVVLDEAGSRYVLLVDGEEAGFAAYSVLSDDLVDFDHTVVHEAFQGRGLSKPLIRGALDGARERGLSINASCSAVARFLEKNPDYADLLAD
ncbi:GNAT family N-acetyltransferase [Corynebacterium sp.]|uniref:GNAT family N-acetyltransferase n=1 Tax=Corynebacterium sp. TaxID=1720 RepID=UPI0034A1172C